MFYLFSELSDSLQDKFILINQYVSEFLNEPHPYRKGNVCPFIKEADLKGLIRYCVLFSDDKNSINIVLDKVCRFQIQNNKGGAIILLFDSDLSTSELEMVKNANRLMFLKAGLMLGLFHPDSNSPSIHGINFYPLRTPSSIMVVRDISISDLVFYEKRGAKTDERKAFLESYIRLFSRMGGDKLVILRARRVLDKMQKPLVRRILNL